MNLLYPAASTEALATVCEKLAAGFALPALRPAKDGTAKAKKRAVVLFTIWKRQESHQPFPALA